MFFLCHHWIAYKEKAIYFLFVLLFGYFKLLSQEFAFCTGWLSLPPGIYHLFLYTSLGKISAQKTFILAHCLFCTIPRQWRILKINKILFYQFIQFNTLRFHNSTREKGIFLRNASYMTCQHSKKYSFLFLESPQKRSFFEYIFKYMGTRFET